MVISARIPIFVCSNGNMVGQCLAHLFACPDNGICFKLPLFFCRDDVWCGEISKDGATQKGCGKIIRKQGTDYSERKRAESRQSQSSGKHPFLVRCIVDSLFLQVSVKAGYMRNYLYPQRLAVYGTKDLLETHTVEMAVSTNLLNVYMLIPISS